MIKMIYTVMGLNNKLNKAEEKKSVNSKANSLKFPSQRKSKKL